MKKQDGTGAEIVDDAEYYVQESSTKVGNCGSWWAPKGAGYVCCIDDAGVYSGKDVRSMRDTDVPWPVAYVLERAVRHVRIDVQAFTRRDEIATGTPICAQCGAPKTHHPYKHAFRPWEPGMPKPRMR